MVHALVVGKLAFFDSTRSYPGPTWVAPALHHSPPVYTKVGGTTWRVL